MAELTERRILVFDVNGLIGNVERLSWKIKAIVAQEEREKIARRVRDNLRYLRRNGQLLGTIPQGYRCVEGEIVEDPGGAASDPGDLSALRNRALQLPAPRRTPQPPGRQAATRPGQGQPQPAQGRHLHRRRP
jgi:hypothetical protein